jgi:hypothetical protein
MIVALLSLNHMDVRKIIVLIKRALAWMEAQTSYPSFLFNKTRFTDND